MAVEWLTTNEYARVKHMHPQRVRDLCAKGQIQAEKHGKAWRIPYAAPTDIEADAVAKRAISAAVEPCLEVIDALIGALGVMRRQIEEATKEQR